MCRTLFPLAVCFSLAAGVPVWCEEDSDSERDVLYGAVDPFLIGPQRRTFLRAAGVDSELDRDEFVAEKRAMTTTSRDRQGAGNPSGQMQNEGFLRPFDAWPGLAKFDKNKSNTIDWVEFHEYRKLVLKVLLKHHDKNKDDKLRGEERDEANRALAERKLLKYLDAECCGGEATTNASEPTPEQYLETYTKVIKNSEGLTPEIEEESTLLPHTSISSDDVESLLNQEIVLKNITNERHRQELKSLLTSELNWQLTADRQDFFQNTQRTHVVCTRPTSKQRTIHGPIVCECDVDGGLGGKDLVRSQLG